MGVLLVVLAVPRARLAGGALAVGVWPGRLESSTMALTVSSWPGRQNTPLHAGLGLGVTSSRLLPPMETL
jgi:hypothetical protein